MISFQKIYISLSSQLVVVINFMNSTLASCAFGTFPALMSLDVHYCSQMRDICKENMIAALLKSAQELEIYAREAEYGCAKVRTLNCTCSLKCIVMEIKFWLTFFMKVNTNPGADTPLV